MELSVNETATVTGMLFNESSVWSCDKLVYDDASLTEDKSLLNDVLYTLCVDVVDISSRDRLNLRLFQTRIIPYIFLEIFYDGNNK